MITRSTLRHAVLFAISLFAVQGTAYVLQLEAAARLDVVVFDQIRVVESLVAVLSMFQTLGIPSVSLAKIAATKSTDRRRVLAVGSTALVLLLSALVSVIYLIAQRAGATTRLSSLPTWSVLVLSASVALRLNFISLNQGRLRFTRLAGGSCFGAVLAYTTTIALRFVGVRAEEAWVASRIVLELGLCFGLALPGLYQSTGRDDERATADGIFSFDPSANLRLFRDSFPVGLSLLLRAAIEHGPILLLADIHAQTQVVGVVGLVLTLGAIALMPSGVLLGALLPALATQLSGKPAAGKRRILLVQQILAFGALPAMLMYAALMVGPALLPVLRGVPSQIIATAVVLVWLKSMTSAFGAYLLAAHLGKAIMVINSVVAALGVIGAISVRHLRLSPSADQALTGIVALEVVSVTLYVICVLFSGHRATDSSAKD